MRMAKTDLITHYWRSTMKSFFASLLLLLLLPVPVFADGPGTLKFDEDSFEVFENVGMAIVVNTIILAIGFLVMTASAFKPNLDMGLMTVIAIVFALVLDFLLLPALLLLGKKGRETDTAGTTKLLPSTA